MAGTCEWLAEHWFMAVIYLLGVAVALCLIVQENNTIKT